PGDTKYSSNCMLDLSGKVTGGTTGIGKETPRTSLTLEECQSLDPARDKSKGEATVRHPKKSTTGHDAHLLLMELANLESTKATAEEFLRCVFSFLSWSNVEQLTEDGYDLQFGTSVLDHFYVTKLILPLFFSTAKSAPDGIARVVNTDSNGYRFKKLKFDTWRDRPARRKRSEFSLYGQSKAVSSPSNPRRCVN
ncbi:hypothetical protein BU15DRAFT_52072, partial [Melanogaster broomeanus]